MLGRIRDAAAMKIAGKGMISRGGFLKLVGGAAGAASLGLLASCEGGETTNAGEPRETPEGQPEVGSAANEGRLLAKPVRTPPPDAEARAGLRTLGLGSRRDGLLYVPSSYDVTKATPLALTLHGAATPAAASPISSILPTKPAASSCSRPSRVGVLGMF